MPRGASERDSSLQRSLDALTQTLKEHKNVVEADTKARTGTSLGGGGGSGGGGGGGGKSFLESLGLSKDPAKAGVEFGQSALSRVSQVVASNPLAAAGVDAASAALSGAKAGPLGAVIGGVTSFGTSLAQDFFAQRERSSQAAKGGYLSAPLGVSDEVAQRYGKHAEGQELLTNDSLGNRLADIEDDALSFFGIEGYGGREGRLKGAREDQQKFQETYGAQERASQAVFSKYAGLVANTGRQPSKQAVEREYEFELRRQRSLDEFQKTTRSLVKVIHQPEPEHKLLGG